MRDSDIIIMGADPAREETVSICAYLPSLEVKSTADLLIGDGPKPPQSPADRVSAADRRAAVEARKSWEIPEGESRQVRRARERAQGKRG